MDNSENVLNVLHNLYIEKQMCDVSLIVGEHEHLAHRLILCASSDVFQVNSRIFAIRNYLLYISGHADEARME